MFFGYKIKLNAALYEKLKSAAAATGAMSVDELAESVLEREVDRLLAGAGGGRTGKQDMSKEEVQQMTKKLKGLGYLE